MDSVALCPQLYDLSRVYSHSVDSHSRAIATNLSFPLSSIPLSQEAVCPYDAWSIRVPRYPHLKCRCKFNDLGRETDASAFLRLRHAHDTFCLRCVSSRQCKQSRIVAGRRVRQAETARQPARSMRTSAGSAGHRDGCVRLRRSGPDGITCSREAARTNGPAIRPHGPSQRSG